MTKIWGRAFRPGPLDIYDVLEDPDHPVFLDLGRLLWSLVPTQSTWVFRRVETATLVGERRIRRRMSVDCRVPPTVIDLAGQLELDRFMVPLRFVMRQSLLSFDLHLGRNPVPLLTRDQNIMATRALLHAAVEQCRREPDLALRTHLARVAQADTEAAPETLDVLGLSDDPMPGETVEEGLLRWAVTTFDQNYLLLADVALDALQDRTLFKITQELPQHPVRSRAGVSMPVRQEIAWEPMSFVFDTPDVTTAGSYHFQFAAPDGLTISGGFLLAADDDGVGLHTFGTATSRTSVLGLNAHPSDVPDSDSYGAVVHVRPSPEGVMRASAASATMSTVLLLIAAAAAHRLDEIQLGPSITLLLVIPGLVSTFLARPGEHSMVSRVLRGTRVLSVLSALVIYTAAGMLVLGVTGPALRFGWLSLALLSAFPATALLLAVRRCRPREWE
jgi:hypothetical protein